MERPMTSSGVATVTVHELREMLSRANPPLLLDVREPEEWQFCRIKGAQHLPMSQLEQRAAELDPARETVVYCHLGARSQMVLEFLITKGFSRVASLAGGIDAWSVFVDPAVARY